MSGFPRILSPAISILSMRHIHIAYPLWEGVRIVVDTTPGMTACADSKVIRCGHDFFTRNLRSHDERAFVIGHEALHVLCSHSRKLEHWSKRGAVGSVPYDWRCEFDRVCLQHALDYIVNDLLVQSKVAGRPGNAFHESGFIDWKTPEPVAYQRMRERYESKAVRIPAPGICAGHEDVQRSSEPPSGEPSSGEPNEEGASGGNSGVTRGMDGEQEDFDVGKATAAMQRALSMAKAMGHLSADMARGIDEMLRPRLNLKDVLPVFLRRRVGKEATSWARPRRRWLVTHRVVLPTSKAMRAGTVVFVCDTSGSIRQKQLELFLGLAANAIEQVKPSRLIVLAIDARVKEVHDLKVEDASKGLKALTGIMAGGLKGGGGTAMPAAFDWCAEKKIAPDAMIIATDGLTPFGTAPRYPVLWAITDGIVAPWGKTAVLA